MPAVSMMATSTSFLCTSSPANCIMEITSMITGERKPSPTGMLAFGQNSNYLFELTAQPGGPEGRSLTTAGSRPIPIHDRPQGVRPSSPGLDLGSTPCPKPGSATSRSHFATFVQLVEGLACGPKCCSGINHARYDAFGQLAAEYYSSPVTVPCVTCYLTYDYLGNVRMVTDAGGNVVARHDFAPFGQEVAGGTAGRGRSGD